MSASHKFRKLKLSAAERQKMLELRAGIVSIVGCKENLEELRAVYTLLTPRHQPSIAPAAPKPVQTPQLRQASARSLRGLRS